MSQAAGSGEARTEPKFVQIAACEVAGNARVYALDATGRVWQYAWNEKGWRSLGEARGPALS